MWILIRTYNLDPIKLEKAISPKTKAIIPVSLYGQPADFYSINEIAGNKRSVIEDAAQVSEVLNMAIEVVDCTIGTTSFFPSKPLGGYGDGGACFTNNFELADRIRRISRHGQARRYFHTEVGVNGRIDTLQAAILLGKWPNFADEVVARQRIGAAYTSKLKAAGFSSTPKLAEGNTSVYAQYTVQVNQRTEVQALLKQKGIPTAVHYPHLLCQQPALRCKESRCKQECAAPLAKQASTRVLSLPMHPWLSDEDQNRVVEAVIDATQSNSTPTAA